MVMFCFIKPNTVLKFPKDHKITEFIKVKYSKKSNEHFNQVLKLWNITQSEKRQKKEVKL
jgi:hypothetical protein